MQIIGHQRQLEILNKSIERGTVAQAYLFVGPENVGKFTVAEDFAQKLTGVRKGHNPNVYILKPEIDEEKNKKLEIKIEQIKDLQHWLGLSSFENQTKVAIIDDAQKLNKTSQNALLKTLEDARENTVVILVSQDENKILPTIISRSHKIKFGTVSDNDLKYFSQDEIGEEVIFWSMGKPGLLKKLLESSDELEFRREVFKEFSKIFSQNVVERMVLAEEMSQDLEMSIQKMNLWMIILRESIVSSNINEDFTDKKMKLMDGIEKSLNLLKDTNANSKLIIENLLINF